MTPPPPPRFAESLVQTLGADPGLVDIVLGDMAEEFGIRAQWDGERAARRWYNREVMRTVPHLLRNALRRISVKDVAELAGILASSYVMVLVLASITVATIVSVLRVAGVTLPRPDALPIMGVALGAMSAFAGAYVAAWLSRKAPLLAALAFGAAWSTIDVIMWAVLHRAINKPVVSPVGIVLAVMVATAAGGLARVRTLARNKTG